MQGLEDLALSFNTSLLALTGASIKPILIIAHSLGGLVVKQVSSPPSASSNSMGIFSSGRPLFRSQSQRFERIKISFEQYMGSPSLGYRTTAWI